MTHEPRNFLETLIDEDLAKGRVSSVHTRFPPEPNGFLHIGHAKAICANFGLAAQYGGLCNLRFDDTNPVKEDTSYVDAIQEDIRWLGFDWEERLFYASDYFGQLYEWARTLIEKGAAYVCDLPLEQVREQRGGPDRPGTDSPYRARSAAENLELFERMKAGEFEEGSRTLRAKIDMAHANLLLRDPVLYRILETPHHRTGTEWNIYPTYDWAHGQSDAIEGITHSLCSIEFVNHRPLYDWFLDQLGLEPRPHQYEFARLKLTHTVVAKRVLRRLVEDGLVDGWDDPRMPTLRGLRRRGYTPSAIRSFCDEVGITKTDSTHDFVLLENELRSELNETAPRRMAVLRPLRVVIENYPEGETEELEAVNNPQDESAGTRKLAFGRELWIDRDDFREDPPRKFFRLGPDREVRLRYAYCITCREIVRDESGEVVELRCTYDPETGGGQTPDGRKVKGIIHWVHAPSAVDAEVRLYNPLFLTEDDEEGDDADPLAHLNPDSLEVLAGCKLEASLADAEPGAPFQFERTGYFCLDTEATAAKPVFHRSVSLRDTWSKIEKRAGATSS